MEEKVRQKIRSLPITQQVALWTILRLPEAGDKDFNFRSSAFAQAVKKFISEDKKKNDAEYGRFIGGILSSLSRNKILRKLSGDRDKLWTLSNEVKANLELYKKLLFEAKTYWPNSI